METKVKKIKSANEARFFYEVLGLPEGKQRWVTINKTTSYEFAKKRAEEGLKNGYTQTVINRVEKLKTFNLNRKVNNEQTR